MNLIIRIAIILAKCCIILAASTNRLRFRDERIIGGHEARPNSHPYIVSLQLRFFWVRAHICGGSILTENWILTAGHCITESWIIRWLPMDAIAGAHNVDKFGPKAQIIGIDQRIPHPLYMGGIGAHDIAMLKTKLPITFTKAVQPVNLPQPNFRYENLDSLKLSGWGALRTTLVFPDMPSNLQEVDLTFVPFEKCYDAFDKLAEDEEIPLDKDSNMCTGPITGGVAACSGDSGGPLVYYFKTKYVNARGKVLRHDFSQPKIRHIRQSDDSTTTEDPDETMSISEESQSTTEETSSMEECRSAKCMNTEDTDETMTTEESKDTTMEPETTTATTMTTEESEQTATEEETITTEEPDETSTMEECRSGKCMNTEDTDETTTTEEPEKTSTMEECISAKCMNTEDTDETITESDTTTTENADDATTEQETTTTEEPEETSTVEECRSGKCMNTEDLEETTTDHLEETTTEEETIATEEELSETESTTTEDLEETTTEEETITTEEPEGTTSTTEVPTSTDADSSEEYYSYEYQDLLDYIYYIFFGDDDDSDENSEDDDDDDEETLRRQPRLVESVERNEAIPMILGVVSWGVAPCGEKGAPTVYTKVSSHIDFINEHIYS